MSFIPGKNYSGFILKKHKYNEEIKSDIYLFEHALLGCPLLAIKNSDRNKTFTAAFNTIPSDSTGVAHILEHSVLMGSKKYPVKDVFGEINKGGLLTYLNALTGSDVTYYPFATRNMKEYFNIMDVYCDVIFNPLLEKSTFEQEGWHYHLEREDDKIQYQGVVYNEMKGAFSDPIRLIFYHIFKGLFPNSTYAHESGGDPANIPDLTYENFCDFHKKHYHPSNSMLFVYGDAPLKKELAFLQDKFLSGYTTPAQKCDVSFGPSLTEPVFVTDTYNIESTDLSGKTFLAIGSNVSTVTNRKENIAFQIIANILFNSDGSPLKNTIVSSGLCKDFGGFYLTSSCFKTIMVSYLVGSEEEHREEFLKTYKSALEDIIKKGLDKDLILSELNKTDFSIREESSKVQRGLELIGKSLTAFKYGTDPFDHLEIQDIFAEIKKEALEENYFEKLIQTFLLDNPASVTVTLKPDQKKLADNLKKEEGRLNKYNETLSDEEKKELVRKTTELMKSQMAPNPPEKLSLLPQLQKSDLESNIHFYNCDILDMSGHKLMANNLNTNGISYLDVGFPVDTIPQKYLPFTDLFATIVTEIGTKKLNYMEFAKEAATCTGGLSHTLSTYTKKGETSQIIPVLWFHIKCLPEYHQRTLDLITEVFSNYNLEDKSRIREIVMREFAWSQHSAHSEGYSLASTRAFSHLSYAGLYNEYLSGITSYLAIKDLVSGYEEKEEEFLHILRQIARCVFNRKNMLLCATADEKELAKFIQNGASIIDAVPEYSAEKVVITRDKLPDHEAFITSAEVVYAVESGNLLENGSGYSGHFEVLKSYLSRDYLWNSVRQMGGAYGCFIQFSQITGNIAFVSYRDPQVAKTYNAYNAIPEIIAGLDLSEEAMTQLIIGTYGNFVPHQSPAAKGATARNDYLNNITPEDQMNRLSEIVSTRPADLKEYSTSFKKMFEKSHRVTIGNRDKIEKDRHLFEKLTEI